MAEMKILTQAGLEYLVGKIDGEMEKKVDKVEGKGLSKNDFTDAYKSTIDGLVSTGGQANVIESVKVNGTALTPDASKAVNIDLSAYAIKTEVETALEGKVDKVDGSRLMTTAEGNKLSKLADDPNGTYATKDQVSAIPKFAISVVDVLPTKNISGTTIYLVPNSGSGTNSHDEFIYAGGVWELLGTTQVDITGKADKSYVDTELAKLVPQTRKVAGKALSADITLAKGDVGLGNVDNTADKDKPISTATQTALDAKVNTADLVAITNTEIDGLFTA